MDCPLCGERCSCSFAPGLLTTAEHVAVLIDPDLPESTEEQFEASLDSGFAAEAAPARYRTIALEQPVPVERTRATEPSISEEQWRAEVSSRVRGYRQRRKRDTSACLSLDFEQTVADVMAEVAQSNPQPTPAAYIDFEHVPEVDGVAPTSLVFVRRREPCESSKIIEFPRPVEELAEPVLDRPRILEAPAPEQLVLGPALGGITLAGETHPEFVPETHRAFELPLRVAPVPLRAMAALLDWLLVLVATAVFALVAVRMMEKAPQEKGVLALGLIVIALFWAVYQYMFLVYGRITPGMQFAGLRLCRFEGDAVDDTGRRRRAFALVLSCVSIGLGFAWAAVDEDQLCWHDRISRTYVTN